MPRKILFVGGIHGVGKSTLCDSICERMNVAHHSASELISKFVKVSHSANKRVTDVGKNQDVLIAATKTTVCLRLRTPGSLSGLKEIGCKSVWPVHISPLFWSIERLLTCKIVKICPRPADNR